MKISFSSRSFGSKNNTQKFSQMNVNFDVKFKSSIRDIS